MEAARVLGGRAQQHHDLLAVERFDHPLDLVLTFQVKGAGGRSDEAVGLLQHHLGAGGPGARGDGPALDPVALAEHEHLLALEPGMAEALCPWVGEKPGSPWARALEITDSMQDPGLQSSADWPAGSGCALRRDLGVRR